MQSSQWCGVCLDVLLGIQTLPSVSAFLLSNFFLTLWFPPLFCSWNVCFLVSWLLFYSSLLLCPTYPQCLVHNAGSLRICWTHGPYGTDVFFDVSNCLETSGCPKPPQFLSVLAHWALLSLYLALTWYSFFFFFYLQVTTGNSGADYNWLYWWSVYVIFGPYSVTGPRTKDKSFKHAAFQLSHWQSRNVPDILQDSRIFNSNILSL